MTRPLVGITACTRTYGEEIAQLVIERYMAAAIRFADVDAVLIPARPDLVDARAVAARIDGLLLTGSPSNLQPARYGDDAEGIGPFDPLRDEMSARLIAAMIHRARPVLGICRGFQELNVAFGGTLARDYGAVHHAPDGAGLDAMFGHSHEVALTPGGVLSDAFGRTTLMVNSVHFQGVARLGDGLAVEAAAPDGVIEAVSASPNGAAILGVQWHPEWRTERDAASRGVFEIFGRALRGLTVTPAQAGAHGTGSARRSEEPPSMGPDFRRDDDKKKAPA